MNNQPSGLAAHSVGSIYPLVLVGFGDNTWGIRRPDGLYMTGKRFQVQRTASPADALRFLTICSIEWAPLRPYSDTGQRASLVQPAPVVQPQRANWYGEDDRDGQEVDFKPAKLDGAPGCIDIGVDTELARAKLALAAAERSLDVKNSALKGTKHALAVTRDSLVSLADEHDAARRLLREAYQHERWMPSKLSNDIRKFLEA